VLALRSGRRGAQLLLFDWVPPERPSARFGCGWARDGPFAQLTFKGFVVVLALPELSLSRSPKFFIVPIRAPLNSHRGFYQGCRHTCTLLRSIVLPFLLCACGTKTARFLFAVWLLLVLLTGLFYWLYGPLSSFLFGVSPSVLSVSLFGSSSLFELLAQFFFPPLASNRSAQ